MEIVWYRISAGSTVENASIFFSNLNAVVTVSKGLRGVKLCSNRVVQFLTGGAS